MYNKKISTTYPSKVCLGDRWLHVGRGRGGFTEKKMGKKKPTNLASIKLKIIGKKISMKKIKLRSIFHGNGLSVGLF